jgi:hypothetical protein
MFAVHQLRQLGDVVRSPLGQHHQFGGAKHDCVTRLDRDRAAGVNHAWNSRLRCRDTSPAVPMAYRRAERRLGEMMAELKEPMKSCGGLAVVLVYR